MNADLRALLSETIAASGHCAAAAAELDPTTCGGACSAAAHGPLSVPASEVRFPLRSWKCTRCDGLVEMHFDHVRNCNDAATRVDCPGTFAHPRASSCVLKGTVLSHDEVRVRGADGSQAPP